MLINNIQSYNGNKRHLRETMSEKSLPLSSYPMTQYNNRYFERPLKNNSENLSFKGLSFEGNETSKPKDKKQINPTLVLLGTIAAAGVALRFAPGYKKVGEFSVNELQEFLGKYNKSLKQISSGLIDNLKESKLAKKMVVADAQNPDKITLYKKTVPQLIWDGLKYPFTILPADLLNASVEMLGKIKPLKNWSENVLQKPFFKNIRQRSKIDAKVNSLQGLYELKADYTKKLAEGKITDNEIKSQLFQRTVKMFDTQKYGAYDTKHERALNRLVSGLPPAIFLANDAYNLSRMMDDDAKKANKEQKTRFRQEVTRILTSGYLTLITLGALNKYINNSKAGIMIMTGGTVLITEAFSRLINGKHIKRLTPEEARRENEKNDAPEKNIKPDTSFKANIDANHKNHDQNTQKPLLTFSTIMKASGVVIAAGFGIKGLRKLPKVDNFFKMVQAPFENAYKKITEIPDYTISKDKFDKIIKVIEENGYKDLAADYKAIAKGITDEKGIMHLGKKDKAIVKPAVNFVLAPFKFAYNAVTLPYRLVDKFIQMFAKKPQAAAKTTEQITKEISKTNIETLAKTIESIGDKALQKGITPKEFQTYVNDNVLKAVNTTTMSNVSNAELSNLAKTAATAATLWFLMTDNYNMVMLKSNGNDKSGAETKFKERFVQEMSRLFYQTLLIDLFNSTFRKQYNASLLGMSWVTLTDTTLGEILTRKSVGMPIGAHTRDELQAIEDSQVNATGFKKGFYNFMQRLTGKRSISSYNVSHTGHEKTPVNVELPLNFTHSSLVSMIKQ